MKTVKYPLFVAIALAATTTCSGQTAEDIVARNQQAVGGKAAIAAIQSIVITATLKVMGNEVPSTTTIVTGKGFRNETDFSGTKIIQVVRDHDGWTLSPVLGRSGVTPMDSADVQSAQGQLYPIPLTDSAAGGGKLDLLGQDNVDYKVKLTNNTGLSVIYYINTKTYLIDKADIHTTRQGQTIDATATFSDYRRIENGVLMPFKVQRDLPEYKLTFILKKVEVNKAIDPTLFAVHQ